MLRPTVVVLSLACLIGRAEAQEQPIPPANPPAGGETGAPTGTPRAPALPPLPAHLQSAPTPKSPAPAIALASWNEGSLYLRLVLPFPKDAAMNAAGREANAPGGELASIAQPIDIQQVQVQTADGKTVGQDALPQRLAKETPVLIGMAQIPPDPMFLRVVKGDTLVLLLPAQLTQRAPGAPTSPGSAPPRGTLRPPGAAAPAPSETNPAPR